MLEFVGFMTALVVVAAIALAVLLSIALPVGWLWMLIDAILREDADYPGVSANSRLMWVLLMALLPVTAIAYFFLVYAKTRRGAAARGDAYQSPPQTTAIAPAAPVSPAG